MSNPLPRAGLLRPRVARLFGLLDTDTLYARRWQMLPAGAPPGARQVAREELDRLMLEARGADLWRPQACFGFLHAAVEGDALVVRAPRSATGRLRVSPALRDRAGGAPGSTAIVALQLVTMGDRVARHSARLTAAGRIADAFLLHGLAAELTESLAEYTQRIVMRRAGWPEARRASPGYPAWPDLADNTVVFRLLRPERIGVSLTETFQMVPEYSTSALVLPR